MTATSVRFECENCHRGLQARAEAAGRRVRCPGCGHRTLVQPYPDLAPAGVRVRWPWLAAAVALVVIAGASGLGVGAALAKWAQPVPPTPGGTPVVTDPNPGQKMVAATESGPPPREAEPKSPATTPQASPAGKADPDLQGTWRLVKVYDHLEPGTRRYISVSSFYQITVRETEQVVESDGEGARKTTKYTLTTDPSRTPRVYRRTGADGKEYVGIYKVEGNKLTMCSQKGDQPPDDFTSRKDDGKGRTIMEFERVK